MRSDELEDIDIQHLKLADGSEIIGYINSIDGNMVLLERPMLLGKIVREDFETFFFSKFMPFAENNIVKVNLRNIIATCQVTNDVKERYIHAAVNQHRHDTEVEHDDIDEPNIEPISKTYH